MHRFSARREQVPPRGADVRAAQLREVHDAGEEEAVRVEATAPRHALCVLNSHEKSQSFIVTEHRDRHDICDPVVGVEAQVCEDLLETAVREEEARDVAACIFVKHVLEHLTVCEGGAVVC